MTDRLCGDRRVAEAGSARDFDSGASLSVLSGETGGPTRDFLDKIIDSIADPVFVKDDRHRWIAVNEALCSLIGHPRAEILGKSDFDYFPEEEARTFWEKDELVFREGGVNVNEERLTDASGKTHILVTKKRVFSDGHGRKILVGVIRDVTEQKQAEAALRAAHDELEERVLERTREVELAQAHLRQAQKMEAVGQLTGGIAHDFNNLLAILVGSLELVKRKLSDGHPALDHLEHAFAAAERGANLTHRLLAFSRRQALKPVPTDVSALVEDLHELLKRSLGETITVRTLSRGPLPATLVDPVALETAILNLAINARDAMPGGGDLTIVTSAAVLDEAYANAHAGVKPGRYVLLEVSDTGLGIDAALVERVFEPFFTTKESGRGSGLGLSMVYGFVKQSGGHIAIRSKIEQGTTVELYLPCDDARPAPAGKPATHSSGTHCAVRRLLIVEDEADFRRVVVSLVESLGHQCAEAQSGQDALEMITGGLAIDVLLTDVVLPGKLTGPDLAERVLEVQPDVAVIFMSGYTADAITCAGPLDPNRNLLHKPFFRADLDRAIERGVHERTAR